MRESALLTASHLCFLLSPQLTTTLSVGRYTNNGRTIEHHLTLMMFTMSFHNINYTLLSLAIIPYLPYGPLMGINAPTFGTKYIGTPPPNECPPPTTHKNTMPSLSGTIQTVVPRAATCEVLSGDVCNLEN